MNRFIALFVVLVFVTPLASARAVVIVGEDFESYVIDGTGTSTNDSDLNSNTGGSGSWNGGWEAATSGENVIDATGLNLSYAFSEGTTISGGTRALEIGGVNNDNLVKRNISGPISDNVVYTSFFVKRTAGTGAAGSKSLNDFAVWWLNGATDTPNIGVFDESGAGNHLMARFSTDQNFWAQGGGTSNTDDAYLVVARLSKGNNATNADDYDGWDLWLFNNNEAARSVMDFRTPDATARQASNTTSIGSLGIRTVNLESDDRIVYDELTLSSSLAEVVGQVVPIASNGFERAKVLDFESVATPTTVGASDSLFTDFGIAQVTATGGSPSGDFQNQTGQTGNALFYNGTDLLVLPQADDGPAGYDPAAYPFGPGQAYTIDLELKQHRFGVSFQDQVTQDFTFTFYLDGVEQGQIAETLSGDVSNAPLAYETPFEFNRVVIQGSNATDGIGIDNITLDDNVINQITLDRFGNAAVLDFEGVTAPVRVNGTDSLFSQFGIQDITAVAADGTDVQNQNGKSGKSLFADGTGLMVLPEANEFAESDWQFGATDSFTLELSSLHKKFGVSFQDQTNQDFTFSFFLNDELLGEMTVAVGSTVTDLFAFQTSFWFDKVVIDGSHGTDGWGIDNITLEASAIPEPSSWLLLITAAMGLALWHRRRR